MAMQDIKVQANIKSTQCLNTKWMAKISGVHRTQRSHSEGSGQWGSQEAMRWCDWAEQRRKYIPGLSSMARSWGAHKEWKGGHEFRWLAKVSWGGGGGVRLRRQPVSWCSGLWMFSQELRLWSISERGTLFREDLLCVRISVLAWGGWGWYGDGVIRTWYHHYLVMCWRWWFIF